MLKTPLPEEKFSRLDLHSIAKLLESSYGLLNQELELRDPLGRVVLSYPSSDLSLCPDYVYQNNLHPKLTSGEIEKIAINNPDHNWLIGLPIVKGYYFMGSLVILSTSPSFGSPDLFSQCPESIRFYQVITDFVAKEYMAQLDIFSLSEELAIRYEELNLFYKVGEWLKGVQETEESIQLIIDKIIDTLEVDYGFITLPQRKIFASSTSVNNHPSREGEHDYLKKLGNELLELFSENELIILDQIHAHPRLKPYFFSSSSLIAVPITMNATRQGALGIAFVQAANRKKFTTGDVRLLQSMAEVISIILKNTELYQNLETFLVNVVKCLVSAIEAKDIYTRGHSERVNHISNLIAKFMDLSPSIVESINWASMLHDIGKIGIPEAILTKPGKLTDEEFAEIKKHPERGYIILKPIQGFQPALDGVRFHQERYDGRGYPRGLKGGEIPLSARIIAIADTYDAITSDRAYRKGLSHQEAITEIKRVAGTQLDPNLVSIFIQLITNYGPAILQQKQEKEVEINDED